MIKTFGYHNVTGNRDTIDKIARDYFTTIDEIQKNNPNMEFDGNNHIKCGQKIKVPVFGEISEDGNSVIVNRYISQGDYGERVARRLVDNPNNYNSILEAEKDISSLNNNIDMSCLKEGSTLKVRMHLADDFIRTTENKTDNTTEPAPKVEAQIQESINPDIETNVSKESLIEDSKYVFKASDGNYYNWMEIAGHICGDIRYKMENRSFWTKIFDSLKSFLGFRNSSKEVMDNIKNSNKLLTMTREEVFEELTNTKYSDSNLEKFIKGEIKTKLEKSYQNYSKTEYNRLPLVPILDGYKTSAEMNMLNSAKREMNNDEKIKYNKILSALDSEYRKKLETILNEGYLLLNNSNDSSSILDNLYKICTNQRARGLSNKNILKNCIDILENKYIITQIAEDMPEKYRNNFVKNVKESDWNFDNDTINKRLNHFCTSTCAATSLEFDLVSQKPAEFFRIVEGITSSKMEVKIKLKNQDLERIKLFKTPYEVVEDGIIVTLAPDKNALLRAQMQNDNYNANERSMIDVLMQSTIMQLGSSQTYDSILDKRKVNQLTCETEGLINLETEYAKSILLDCDNCNEIYTNIDKGKVIDHNSNKAKKDLDKALAQGKVVTIGYIFGSDGALGGHEIVVVGKTKNLKNEEFYICQDSDDFQSKPILMESEYLLNQIHHAII